MHASTALCLSFSFINQVPKAWLQAAQAAGYDEETIMVGRALQKDFEQRGVHLNDQDQSRALQLSQDIATLGMNISKPHQPALN